MLTFCDLSLRTSNRVAAKKIQRLFDDFDINGAIRLEMLYDSKLRKVIPFEVFLYSSIDISCMANRNEFLNLLDDLINEYSL